MTTLIQLLARSTPGYGTKRTPTPCFATAIRASFHTDVQQGGGRSPACRFLTPASPPRTFRFARNSAPLRCIVTGESPGVCGGT